MGSAYDDMMLDGEDDEAYESADDCEAEDPLRVGGDSEGVLDAALDEEFDEVG